MQIKIEKTEVFGFGAAMRGMRNPWESHAKADTFCETIGPKDMALAKKLMRSSEERKFMRFIHVWYDLTLPLHTWAQFDTYKMGVVRNSCSTMNSLAVDRINKMTRYLRKEDFYQDDVSYHAISELNTLAAQWKENKEERDKILLSMKNRLPSGYMLKSTVNSNYEMLLNVYYQRKNHRLETWQTICKWIESLPYMSEFINV